MTDRYDELRAAAEAASNGNLDSAESVTVGEIQCPLCGDGVVDHKAWMNIDDKPVGIEVFGIGEALTNYETFVRLANPETIKGLIAERDSLLAALRGLCKAVSSEGVAGALAVHDLAAWANIGEALSVAVAALTTKEG